MSVAIMESPFVCSRTENWCNIIVLQTNSRINSGLTSSLFLPDMWSHHTHSHETPGGIQRFQRLLLLGLTLAVAILDVEHLPGVDVRAGFVEVQRPVQHMNVLAEAFLDGGHELLNDFGQHLRRWTVALLADLINGFFGADAGICQQIVHGAVALGVAGFSVAGVLPGDESTIAALVFVMLMLGEGRILAGGVFLVGAQSVLTVPVEVEGCAGGCDVVRVFYVEAAVVVLGVIDAVLAGASVVA